MPGWTLKPQARTDLRDIRAYTAREWGNEQARRYIIGLYDAFDTLPGRLHDNLPPARPADFFRPGYYRLSVGSHVIFYHPDNAGGVVVVRILHAQRDFLRFLLESEGEI